MHRQPAGQCDPAQTVEALSEGFDRFEAATELAALVTHCSGRTFVAGGDIASFERSDFSTQPYNTVFARIATGLRQLSPTTL